MYRRWTEDLQQCHKYSQTLITILLLFLLRGKKPMLRENQPCVRIPIAFNNMHHLKVQITSPQVLREVTKEA